MDRRQAEEKARALVARKDAQQVQRHDLMILRIYLPLNLPIVLALPRRNGRHARDVRAIHQHVHVSGRDEPYQSIIRRVFAVLPSRILLQVWAMFDDIQIGIPDLDEIAHVRLHQSKRAVTES